MWIWLSCADPPMYTNAVGTVIEATTGVYAVVPDSEPNTRLCLEGPLFTAEFAVAGTRVQFSGNPGEVAPNVRRACLPLKLTALAATEHDAPEH